jgi:hypothetical protein
LQHCIAATILNDGAACKLALKRPEKLGLKIKIKRDRARWSERERKREREKERKRA